MEKNANGSYDIEGMFAEVFFALKVRVIIVRLSLSILFQFARPFYFNLAMCQLLLFLSLFCPSVFHQFLCLTFIRHLFACPLSIYNLPVCPFSVRALSICLLSYSHLYYGLFVLWIFVLCPFFLCQTVFCSSDLCLSICFVHLSIISPSVLWPLVRRWAKRRRTILPSFITFWNMTFMLLSKVIFHFIA